MSDEANVPSGAVIDAPTPHTPELGTQIQPTEKPAVDPKAEVKTDKPAKAVVEKSSNEAVKRAMEAVKAKEAEKAKADTATKPVDKPDAKVDAKPAERTRAEDGKFTPKESTDPKSVDQRTVQEKTEGNQTSEGRKPHHEAPARFNEFGKRDWANTPDTVKEETHRAFKELEEGHKKYKESAERFEKVREFDDLARKNGREGVHESLKQIVEIENTFVRGDPINGFKQIADHFNVNLQAVAAHIMGQNPNQQVAEAHTKIQELEAKIQQMEFSAKAPDIVAEFAAQEGHERFEELTPVIATLLKTGTAKELEAAYELADVLKPAASNAAQTSQPLIPAESASAHPQAPALNPAGSKSVSGAPSGGVSPASKQPVSKSNSEAVKRALARLGT
jgi:hypothetical protein